MRTSIRWILRVFIACLAAVGTAATPATTDSKAVADELDAAWGEAAKVAIYGPAEVPLADQGRLKILKGQAFVPATAANRVMKAMGNFEAPDRVGMVVSTDEKQQWMVDVAWTGEGYVRDGDAKEWQADELLASLKEGTEAQNEDRIARGFPALDIIGWIQPPAYDSTTNRLVWSLAARNRGAAASDPQTVNYNTYALGRNGYFSLDLLTDATHVEADKAVAHQLLRDLRFDDGKRYADFDSSTDKVAAFGLAALVGGAVLKKAGLLTVIGLFLLKVWKIALVALVAAFRPLRSWWQRRGMPADEDVAAQDAPNPDAAAKTDLTEGNASAPAEADGDSRKA